MKKSVFVILLVLFISAFSISMYFVVKETVEDKSNMKYLKILFHLFKLKMTVLIIQMTNLKDISN